MDSIRSSMSKLVIASRSIRYKARASTYPKVNVSDVVLEKPRYGFRKVLEPILSQSVRDEIFPAEVIKQKYLDAGKPVPIKFKNKSDAIARRNYEHYKDSVAMGLPHFRVGEKKGVLAQGTCVLIET
ncbi:hypothetical protein JCM33374_g5856 [Metschnikowia sp. JCM 33374]|nr:hypothetical protein JCM33374_g5856 [Metschnikowia sp. JCM 33374]